MKSLTYLRAALPLAAISIAAGCGGDGASTASSASLAQPPTISSIGDQTVAQDSVSSPIMFTVADDSDATTLQVKAVAKDGSIIGPGGIALSGNGASRALIITPNERAFGATSVIVTATDPGGTYTTRTFKVNVTTMNLSFLSFTTQTVASDENSTPSSLAGVSFTQDAEDPNAFMSQFAATN
jgi:hypothetical protein